MGAFDIQGFKRPFSWAKVLTIALNSYLLHQVLEEDANVVGGDVGPLHRSFGADLAVLTEAPHLDHTLTSCQAHVKDDLHSVGRPASSTCAAFEPRTCVPDVLLPAWVLVVSHKSIIKLQTPGVFSIKTVYFSQKNTCPLSFCHPGSISGAPW